MESIAGVARTAKYAQSLRTAPAPALFGLEHEIGCALAEVQSRPTRIERPTDGLVEYHQRLETVEMEATQALAPAHDNDVAKPTLYQSGAEDNGVHSRRAGRRRCRNKVE